MAARKLAALKTIMITSQLQPLLHCEVHHASSQWCWLHAHMHKPHDSMSNIREASTCIDGNCSSDSYSKKRQTATVKPKASCSRLKWGMYISCWDNNHQSCRPPQHVNHLCQNSSGGVRLTFQGVYHSRTARCLLHAPTADLQLAAEAMQSGNCPHILAVVQRHNILSVPHKPSRRVSFHRLARQQST
jgi:hypothetical protein